MNALNIATLLSQKMLFIGAGLLGLNLVVGFHELGHFVFCKMFNIKTPTFSIGFGSFIVSKKIGDTTFGIARWPLGGYVEIAGLAEVGQGDQEHAQITGPRSFAEKPFWQKFLVMFGGILFNLIFTYFAFSLVFMIGVPASPIAYPANATLTINTIVEDSPAQKAGLKVGDTVKKINDIPVHSAQEFLDQLASHANNTVELELIRENAPIDLSATIKEQEFMGQKRGYLGISFTMQELPRFSFIESIKKGIAMTHTHVVNTVRAFKHIFTNRDTSAVGGPLTIIGATVAGAQKGVKVFILLLALISINLGIMQCLPLPILDGGQIFFAAIEAIIRRPLPEQIREYIHIASWIGIMLLIAYLSVRDILRMIWPYIENLFS